MFLARLSTIIFIVCFWFVCGFAANTEFPKKALVVNRDQADYSSPESTYYALHSCQIVEDLDWCDEIMTEESLQEQIRLFDKAGIDRTKAFELKRNVTESIIVDKFIFRDATIVLTEHHGATGSVQVIPVAFLELENSWKLSNKFSSDPKYIDCFYYVPPLFDGKGQRPADANSFLGYEQPTQIKTELETGTTNYTVHVYYGKTVDPTTFSAKLNKQDISSQFSPKPFTDQEVTIPLQKGRNLLALSINGIRKDGKKAKDSDRLVFLVP